MINLYNKIYEAVNNGIQKALIIDNDQSQDISIGWHEKEITSSISVYEYKTVDLGLPSKLLWCEYNLGGFPGNNPQDWYGNYYAWGEIYEKLNYTWNTYKHAKNRFNLTKYNVKETCGNVDGLKQLQPEDDAVRSIIGYDYRMPDETDFRELFTYTIHKYVNDYKGIYGLKGVLLISKINKNTLFFPFAGYRYKSELCEPGICSNIWLPTLYNDEVEFAANVSITGNIVINGNPRTTGCSIRGVKEPI